MKTREFGRAVKALSRKVGRGKNRKEILCPDKIAAAEPEDVGRLVTHLARNRMPVRAELLERAAGIVDRSWISCTGYLYWRERGGHRYLCCGDALVSYGFEIGEIG